MKALNGYFDHLREMKFWGQIVVTFKDGQVFLLEQKQQFKSKTLEEIQSRKNHQESHVMTDGQHEFHKRFSEKV